MSALNPSAERTQDGEAELARLRARLAVLEAENRHLSAVLRASELVGMWDWDVRADRVVANARFAEYFGVDPLRAAAGGVPIAEYLAAIHPDDLPAVRAAILRTLREGGEYGAEYRLVSRGRDRPRWVAASGRCERDAAGRAVRFSGTVVDITERVELDAALRAEAERVQLALAAGAIIGTWVWEVATDRFTADELFAFTFGLDPAACRAGLRLEQVLASVHPEDLPGLRAAIGEAIGRGGPYRHQYRVRRQDGAYRWIEANGRVELGPDGRPQRFPGVLLDIEERRAIEAERDRATALLRSFIEAVPGVVYAKDRQGRMLIANEGTARLIGKRPEEFIGRTDAEFLEDKAQAAAVMANDRRIMDSGVAEQVEEVVSFPDGRPAFWLSTKAPFRNAAGEVIGLIGTSIDITERKRAEAALRESEAQFRTLADNLPLLCWMADSDGYIVWYNRRWYDYTGTTPAEMEGWGWQSVHDPEELPKVLDEWKNSIATGTPFEMVFPLRGADGVFRPFLTRVVPLRDEAGRITRWFGTNTEVRDIVEAREALARSRAELERLVEERTAELLRAAEERRRAEEAMRQSEKLAALGQLTGGVAHDFNNLLQVISSGASLLKRPSLSEERKAAILDGMIQAGQAARDLIGRLLAFARRQSLAPQTFDLNARLAETSALLAQSLGARIRIETDLAPELWPVHCDPGQLEVALLNLAVNARDAMPEGGTLTLRTRNARLDATPERAAGDYVCLSVQDTGTGMPPAVLARVFEPFFTTKGVGKGTGLGLPQVFGFAKQSGGDIRVESEVGRGTTITLLLPRAAAACGNDGGAGAAERQGQAVLGALQSSGSRTVLIVEDNAQAAEFAAEMLEELGYRTRRAESGPAALAMLAQGEPVDAIFSDIVMPGGIGGIGLAAICRSAYPHLAVVLTTGYSAQLAEGQAPKNIEVLPKPYTQDELAAAIGRALAAVSARAGGEE